MAAPSPAPPYTPRRRGVPVRGGRGGIGGRRPDHATGSPPGGHPAPAGLEVADLRRRWLPAAVCAAALAAGAGGVLASTGGRLPWLSGARGQTALGAGRAASPCGGEALREDNFPPLAGAAAQPALAAQPHAAAPPSSAAPGATDTRPQEFQPDEAAFAQLLQREGASVQMSVFRTHFNHASPSQAANIALVARKLTGQVVRPGAVFSYNGVVGPYSRANGYGWGRMFLGQRIVPSIGGGVCQGASTLYNAVLLADLPVVEQHFHGLTVPYLAPGRDATVADEGSLDFRFRNTTGGPLVLWSQAERRWLTIAIYGRRHPPQVVIHTEVLARRPFPTVVVRDAQLPAGSERVAAPGQDGVTARAWAVIEQPDGTQKRRDLGTHTYRPSPRVILRGPGAPSAAAPSAAG